MKSIGELTKPGIVILVLLCAVLGYGLGFTVEHGFVISEILFLLSGVVFLSAGSLSLNQVQEREVDMLMPRTQKRPIPSGRMNARQAYAIGFSFTILGLVLLYQIRPLTALIGLITVGLYNILYTLYWKRKWTFAAVPGAVPGALPFVIGFSACNPNIFSLECVYGFLIMFFWQMPHFWALAIRYRDDYAKGGFPVLPVSLGVPRTVYHIGLYTFCYVALAMLSPLFVDARYLYFFVVIPIGLKVVWEFLQYNKTQARWLRFFLWVNFSMLAFLLAPVVDKFTLLMEHL